MIFTALLGALHIIFQALFFWLPVINVLPFGIDSVMVQGVGYLWFINTVFPPMGPLMIGFATVLGIKMSLWFLRTIRVIR